MLFLAILWFTNIIRTCCERSRKGVFLVTAMQQSLTLFCKT
jgi:hypothetical protein